MVHVAGERSFQFMSREHPQVRLSLLCPASEDACYTTLSVEVNWADLNFVQRMNSGE